MVAAASAPSIETPPWLTIALTEYGVRERAGAQHHPRILEYLATTSLPAAMKAQDETPWCSAFVNWCLEQVGYRGTGRANARSWLGWGQALSEPRQGCLVVFSRPPDPDSGHVGFFVSNGADRIWVCGGNQDNAVSVSPYPKSRLLAYRWPSIGNRKT